MGQTHCWQSLDGTTIPAPVSNLQANSLGGVQLKEASYSPYFPSPDPSFHPHVPYSMYKLLMKGNGNAGSFPHPHHDLSGTGKHHNIRTDFDVADRHPHSRSGPSIASHLGQIPVPSLPLKSPPSPIGRPAHCCLDFPLFSSRIFKASFLNLYPHPTAATAATTTTTTKSVAGNRSRFDTACTFAGSD